MKKNLSDEQIDLILRRVTKEAAAEESVVDEIAGSPQLWWGIRRSIAEQKEAPKRGWIPAFDWRIAVFATLHVAAGLTVFYAGRMPSEGAMLAGSGRSAVAELPVLNAKESPVVPQAETVAVSRPARERKPVLKAARRNSAPRSASEPESETVEFKSDFIALGYSGVPESGQVLSVKVPRAMMVSLGVSNRVDSGSEYVRAEVLVGDDGTARAIRFVQ